MFRNFGSMYKMVLILNSHSYTKSFFFITNLIKRHNTVFEHKLLDVKISMKLDNLNPNNCLHYKLCQVTLLS